MYMYLCVCVWHVFWFDIHTSILALCQRPVKKLDKDRGSCFFSCFARGPLLWTKPPNRYSLCKTSKTASPQLRGNFRLQRSSSRNSWLPARALRATHTDTAKRHVETPPAWSTRRQSTFDIDARETGKMALAGHQRAAPPRAAARRQPASTASPGQRRQPRRGHRFRSLHCNHKKTNGVKGLDCPLAGVNWPNVATSLEWCRGMGIIPKCPSRVGVPTMPTTSSLAFSKCNVVQCVSKLLKFPNHMITYNGTQPEITGDYCCYIPDSRAG